MAAGLAIPAVVILWPHLTRDRGRLLAILVVVLPPGRRMFRPSLATWFGLPYQAHVGALVVTAVAGVGLLAEMISGAADHAARVVAKRLGNVAVTFAEGQTRGTGRGQASASI